ncbi:Cysteine--tRNA ligase [Chlorella vulgaris]
MLCLDGSELPRDVTWYSCGPTVYDAAHLGHARTYVTFDTLRTVMERYFGLRVTHAMNLTDIDDKIISRSQESGESPAALAERCAAAFFEDMASLGCKHPDKVLRVTELMDVIIAYIQRIHDRGYTYSTSDGLYFDLRRFVQDGHSYGKFRPIDAVPDAGFALWKLAKGSEPRWQSPWGAGRPGWHIECTALASHAFGDSIDVHAGGQDLCFPHHENELAQAIAAGVEAPWVKHWVHAGHLSIAGHKMSKSLKNFISVKEALREFTPRQLRLAFALHPWQQPMSWGTRMTEARARERTIVSFLDKALSVPALDPGPDHAAEERLAAALVTAKANVRECLQDGLDVSSALEHVFVLIREGNARTTSAANGSSALAATASYVVSVLWAMGLDFRCLGVDKVFYNGVRDEALRLRDLGVDVKTLFRLCDEARHRS